MTITDIKPQSKNKSRVSVFIDNEFAFGADEVDVLYYHLAIGEEISAEKLNRITEELIYTKAKDKAARILSFARKSRAELKKRLLEDHSEEIAERVMAMLEKYGYIDDEKYAADFIADGARLKGKGPVRMKFELRQKGVPSRVIEEALESCDVDWYETCSAVLDKKLRGEYITDIKQKKKIIDFLMRRGFDYSTVKEVVAEWESIDKDENY